MTLGFTQTIDGLPNYFIEKIWHCVAFMDDMEFLKQYDIFYNDYRKKFGSDWDGLNSEEMFTPKLHTIRANRHSKWGAGRDIHFVINNRQKTRFQFAPVVKCISVQEIWILKYNDGLFGVKVDGRNLTATEVEQLAVNDGFDNADAFYKYFFETSPYVVNFYGKIIHWTDIRY